MCGYWNQITFFFALNYNYLYLFNNKIISVYSENHPKEYPLALKYFKPKEEVKIVEKKQTFHDKFVKSLASNTPNSGQFDEEL